MRPLPHIKIVDILAVLVILFGCWLRLYHLPQTLLFLGDQGRDALIAKAILRDRDLALIGPVTSVGNMYLGPFYYYFMVPFLALTYPSPIGPAYGVAFVNCLSLLLLYFICRRLFSQSIGLIALFIYALMPLAVTFSRFSWNPNLAAPVGLLLYWFLVRWYQTKSYRYAVAVGATFGILIQLHYVTLTTAGVVGVVWMMMILAHKHAWKTLFFQMAVVLFVIGLSLSPLAFFDWRHDHMLSRQFMSFFTSGEQHMQPTSHLLTVVRELEGRAYRILSQVVTGQKNVPFDRTITLFGAVLMSWIIYAKKLFRQNQIQYAILFAWLGFAIIGTAFYSSSILDHYLTYCFPFVALFWAILILYLWEGKLCKIAAVGIGGVFAFIMINGLMKFSFDGAGIDRYQETAHAVLPYISTPYNIALLGANGDFQGMNYRYFFDVSQNRPQGNEDYSSLSSLVIIDEVNNDNPLSVPAYEIQAPRLASLSATLHIPDGPRVFIFK